MAIKILSSAVSLPSERLLSKDLDSQLGKDSGWLYKATGVHSRHVCREETQISMGVDAATKAIEKADLLKEDIDLIISSCGVPYQTLPSTAPAFQLALGIADGQAFSFDVDSTCLSFLNGMDIADALLNTKRYKRALIISSEVASRALPWETAPEIAGLFGDGAAAVVVENTRDKQSSFTSRFSTFASAYDACQIAAGGTRFDYKKEKALFDANSVFSMNSRELFRITNKHFPSFLEELLEQANWTVDEVDLVVPHQASPAALAHMIKVCGFEEEKVINIVADYGNQIAASIPSALDLALSSNRIEKGQKVLLLGTSAGVSFGGIAYVAE